MNAFISHLSGIDLVVFHAINRFCGQSLFLDQVVSRLESAQLKGLVFIGTFAALWFQRAKTQVRQRETLILLLIAIVLSLIVARIFADLFPFRERPMFASGIGYRSPVFAMDAYFENWSAFPSDTAAIIFAMTTGFWLLSRWWGLLWVSFSITATVARIYFGLHYPGDALAGALIGVGVTLAIDNEFMHGRIAAPILTVEQRAPALFYGLLFPFLLEISTLFSFTRGIYHAISQILRGFVK
jgi:membrane-associated phospholipid phosphatase